MARVLCTACLGMMMKAALFAAAARAFACSHVLRSLQLHHSRLQRLHRPHKRRLQDYKNALQEHTQMAVTVSGSMVHSQAFSLVGAGST